jgi:NADH dehydrogenase
MATITLRSNFRRIDPAKTSILLLEGGKRILPSYASEGSGELRPAVERIRTLSGLDLDMLGDDLDPLVFSKPRYSGLLSLRAGHNASPPSAY